MKKIILSVLAIAALSSCSKFETTYEQENEIGFAPASKNITKAAMEGAMPASQNLSIWAFWDNDGQTGAVLETATNDNKNIYSNYTDTYLANAEFENRSGANWGGANNTKYPWPTNGALVFAGYNRPKGTTTTTGDGENQTTTYTPADLDASYDYTNNTMTFTGYTQSNDIANTFDLCWFGRTSASYNNRNSGAAVPVTLNHALTWITIKVKGDQSVINNWKITYMKLIDVFTTATGVCSTTTVTNGGTTTITNSASWDNYVESSKQEYKIGDYEQGLYTNAQVYESTVNTEDEGEGIVVIPQTPVNLYVEYKYTVAGNVKTGNSTVPLTLTNTKNENNVNNTTIAKWESGKHYTYTLVFKANEILVAPYYGAWTDVPNSTVTVE